MGPGPADASLAILEADEILGAAQARQSSMGVADAARVLVTVNPPAASAKFDALLRAVDQFGLTRRRQAELLLTVLPPGPDGLTARARAAHKVSVRGAVLCDLRRPAHRFLYASVGAVLLATAANLTLHSPMCKCPSGWARTLAWQLLKKSILVAFLAAIWSGQRLARIALAVERARARPGVLAPPVVAAAVAVAAAILAVWWHTPVLFAGGSAVAALVLWRS